MKMKRTIGPINHRCNGRVRRCTRGGLCRARRRDEAAREQSQMIYDAMRPEAKARVAAERAKRSFFYIPIPKDAEPVQPRAAWREGNWARLKAKKDR